LTIYGTTMTTYAPAADIGSEPTAAPGHWQTPAPEDQHPDGFKPRSGYRRSELGPDDLGISDGPKATSDDRPSHAATTGAGL
jgi:hypothetical protein